MLGNRNEMYFSMKDRARGLGPKKSWTRQPELGLEHCPRSKRSHDHLPWNAANKESKIGATHLKMTLQPRLVVLRFELGQYSLRHSCFVCQSATAPIPSLNASQQSLPNPNMSARSLTIHAGLLDIVAIQVVGVNVGKQLDAKRRDISAHRTNE